MLPGIDCSTTTAPIDFRLKVTKTTGALAKQRKTFAIAGLSPPVNYAVYNNNINTLVRALSERVYYVKSGLDFVRPPRPRCGYFRTAMLAVSKYFKKRSCSTTPMKALQFAESYQGRKRTVYLKACASLEIVKVRKKDSFIKAFVKAEKTNQTAKPDSAPRVIQPRDPRYGVSVGRYVKPIEKKIYNMLDRMYGDVTIFKGLNASERGVEMARKWSKYKNPVAIGLDASRFDQHCSVEALKWEHSIYKMFYPANREFAKLLSWQLLNKGVGRAIDGWLTYSVEGCRMSGDMNTSLGNCLLMSSMVYVYCKSIGILKFDLANDGDDCVVIIEKSDLIKFNHTLHEYFLQLGFNMTIEQPVYCLEKIDFCQSHPVFDGENYVMVRNPWKALPKDCVSLKPLDNPKVYKMWCAAVGQSGIHLTGGIPIWQEFYQVMDRTSEGAKPLIDPTLNCGLFWKSWRMDREYSQPTAESRLSFWKAFNISPDQQEAIEDHYRSMYIGFSNDQSVLQRFDYCLF